jgi:hypothetical protein
MQVTGGCFITQGISWHRDGGYIGLIGVFGQTEADQSEPDGQASPRQDCPADRPQFLPEQHRPSDLQSTSKLSQYHSRVLILTHELLHLSCVPVVFVSSFNFYQKHITPMPAGTVQDEHHDKAWEKAERKFSQ